MNICTMIPETPFIRNKENRLKIDHISAISTFCKIRVTHISEHISETTLNKDHTQ